ncbi:MAG: tol-pal system protein YbgF [Gammaproteobacteria bacterium]
MPIKIRTCSLLVLAIVSLVAMPAAAIDRATDERLKNIERKLESRGLVDMFNRLEQLQQDVQQLRGELELQTNRLDGMERRQREQYMDIDRRLQGFETGTPGAVMPIPGTDTGAVLPGPDTGNGGGVATPPPTMPDMPSPAPVVATDPAAEQAEYDTALAILREGRYADAAQSFKQFLAHYPTSSFSANASYWLGETYYVTRDFDQSLATFTGLVNNHPQSPKVSDSRLKIGYIHYEKKDWKAARQELEAVVSNYPGSTAARLASDRLARMKKEGR